MATVISVPSRSYHAGTYVENANNTVPYTSITATFTREAWPVTTPNPALSVTLERSDDNGVTWQFVGAASMPGGVIANRPVSAVTFRQLDPATGDPIPLTGSLRATIIVAATLTTSITVDAT